jgi:L-lactate dehydrogenase complex protein LldG
MSRNRILESVIANKPGIINLPNRIGSLNNEYGNISNKFIDSAISAGADVVELDSIEYVEKWIRKQNSLGKTVFDLTQKSDEHILSSHVFSNSDVVVIQGQMGVAENGAIWIDDKDMRIRKLPFVTGHLVLVLQKEDILEDMHKAYERIDLGHTGFGVFIAGPSKTADIEQSLVIGAHGPVRHTILLLTQSE